MDDITEQDLLIKRIVWNAMCIENVRLRKKIERINKTNMMFAWIANSTNENFERIHDAVFGIVYGEEH